MELVRGRLFGSLSVGAWKLVLLLAGAFTAAILVASCARSPLLFGPSAVGSLYAPADRVTPESVLLSRRKVVLALSPNSPIAKAGAHVGDLMQWDRWYATLDDDPGAEVGLTIWSQGVPRHAFAITMELRPVDTDHVWTRYVTLAYMFTGWLFGMTIGWRQADGRAYRPLALGLLASVPAVDFLLLPGQGDIAAGHIFNALSLWPFWCGPLSFALLYPSDRPVGARARVAAWMPGVHVIAATASLLYGLSVLGWYTGLKGVYFAPLWGLILLAVLYALWEGRRDAQGLLRQRFNWILAAMGSAGLLVQGSWVALALGERFVSRYYDVMILVQLASYFAIAYATLRYRVFDFGLAVNRALVYSTTSLGILMSFGLVEWAAEHLLKFEGRERSAWLDGAIALLVYLVFHKIHRRVEQVIERLIFRRWHQNELLLRTFVRRASHVNSAVRLVEMFASELVRFGSGAPCWIFGVGRYGGYGLAYSIGDAPDPAHVDGDDDLLVALRADARAIARADIATSSLVGEWALPMLHRGELLGFVMVGAKPDGSAWRADEIEVLSFAAHQIGLDLDALRVVELERRVAMLEHAQALPLAAVPS